MNASLDGNRVNSKVNLMAMYAKERGDVQPTRMGEVENGYRGPVIETKVENHEVSLEGNVISNPKIRKNVDAKRIEL